MSLRRVNRGTSYQLFATHILKPRFPSNIYNTISFLSFSLLAKLEANRRIKIDPDATTILGVSWAAGGLIRKKLPRISAKVVFYELIGNFSLLPTNTRFFFFSLLY